MSFSFYVEYATHLPEADLWIVDGKLLSGDISAADTAVVTNSSSLAIRIKNVAIVDPTVDSSRMTLVIEEPPCPIENLEGSTLVGIEALAG